MSVIYQLHTHNPVISSSVSHLEGTQHQKSHRTRVHNLTARVRSLQSQHILGRWRCPARPRPTHAWSISALAWWSSAEGTNISCTGIAVIENVNEDDRSSSAMFVITRKGGQRVQKINGFERPIQNYSSSTQGGSYVVTWPITFHVNQQKYYRVR